MGRTVGHWFHIDNEEFVGNYLKKKRSDPDFSVQKISGANIYGWFATELPGIFPAEEPWWVRLCVAENNFLKEESQLLPNHHIVHRTSYAIPELESQLLPNGSIWDGVGNSWVELESQLLPNRHIMKVAIDMLAELESQLLPKW